MIVFDPDHLFPLLDPGSHTYSEAQNHSAQVDSHLGFHFQNIEENLLKNHRYKSDHEAVQPWVGLPVQAMQTPYTEIRYILSLLNPQPGQSIVDLGCAYGRMGHVVGHHYPAVHFTGYELVKERVEEGLKTLKPFAYANVRLETCDLSRPEFAPPQANTYFIFDFGSASAIEKTLQDLRIIAQNQAITVVARGRGIRHQIYQSHPWLHQMKDPQNFGHFTLFRS